jgi:hypothetical protein
VLTLLAFRPTPTLPRRCPVLTHGPPNPQPAGTAAINLVAAMLRWMEARLAVRVGDDGHPVAFAMAQQWQGLVRVRPHPASRRAR